MSIAVHVTGFIGSVSALPVLAQLSPDTAISKLAVGSAQFVLAVVVVAEAYAIFKMFKLWRDDIQADRVGQKEQSDKLETIVIENAKASTSLAESNRGLTESMHRFANIMETRFQDAEDDRRKPVI